MVHHILNGDCLSDQLKKTNIDQNFIFCRESMITGSLSGESIGQFWSTRSEYISSTYNITTAEYFDKTVREFEKLNTIPDNSEICLWFGNDLFCQANMWFLISMLSNQSAIKLSRIFPARFDSFGTCKGFENSDAALLEKSFDDRITFRQQDIDAGKNLWEAYRKNDFSKLKELSIFSSDCFQFLPEVCQAHIDRFPDNQKPGRPEVVIQKIINSKSADFNVVCAEFSKVEPIYGFGDLQLKEIYDKIIKS